MSSTSRYSTNERGKTPQGWDVVNLSDLLSLEYGVGLPESKRLAGKYPVYGSNGIIGYHNEALIKGPGIVIGRKGSIGVVSWVDSDFWPIDTTYSVLLRRKDVSMKWLFYKLIQMSLSILNAATGVPGLNRGEAYALRLALPPLQEQQKTASILSAADEAIQKSDEIITKTQRLKKGLMQQLFTRGIGHTRFRETEIGAIPEEWEVKSLQTLCEVIADCPHSTPEFTDNGVPIIRNFNIRDGEVSLDRIYYTTEEDWIKRTQRCVPQKNDVLFSREAPIGEASLSPSFKFSLGQRLMLLRPNKQQLHPAFLV